MSASPYQGLPATSFWRSGVVEAHPLGADGLYRKRFEITAEDRITTAGSCFAQHIARAMRADGFNVLDVEPAPVGLPLERHLVFGYGQYSARYSNIYTARQLLQLLREAFMDVCSPEPVWTSQGKFFDSMRPAVEPRGLESVSEVHEHRAFHLEQVRKLFESTDVFIFTLGLTECWQLGGSDWVFPTAPGTVAGTYDPRRYRFKNLSYEEVVSDMNDALAIIQSVSRSQNLRVILTVSPVPLTATYTNDHVLTATTYSKSVLRVAAGRLCERHPHIAYFPSYEMVTAPWSRGIFFDSNLRTVNRAGVEVIMKTFLRHHRLDAVPGCSQTRAPTSNHIDEIACEEALLESFAGGGEGRGT